jgi:hypothetical protein
MPPDMPSHDRAGRHATAPLSPGEFSSTVSRKPRQPHRVRQFHPRARQSSRGNRNLAPGRPLPNLNGHGAHHPFPIGFARTVPTLCRDGRFRNGEDNSSSPRMSPPRGSWGGARSGRLARPSAERNPTPLSHVHDEIPRDTVRDRRGCRLEADETLDRKPDRHPSDRETWSDWNAGRIQSGQTR